ncbi:MAG: hypothetical protein NE330_21760 [Lentisphaeraceae bacterium]|nr:hypothetical protein [Lentisphaeraceae bacterium]
MKTAHIIYSFIYFTAFYIMNDCGYKEVLRNDEVILFERTGFPFNKSFSIDDIDMNSKEAIAQETREVYNRQTLWLHAVNGIPWFSVYFIAIYLIKRKKKPTKSDEHQ